MACAIPNSRSIHILFSLRALYLGLALDDVTKWVALQAAPADCPNCHHNLRPSFPALPWFRRSRRGGEFAPRFVDEDNRYRDEIEDGAGVSGHGSSDPLPDAVKVRSKGKATTPAALADAPWDA